MEIQFVSQRDEGLAEEEQAVTVNQIMLTLEKFQQSEGIEASKQICLIQSHYFPGEMHDCFAQRGLGDYVSRELPVGVSLTIPRCGGRVFCGLRDKSLDSLYFVSQLFSFMACVDAKFEVVLGKGDYEITTQFTGLIPENVSAVWVNNKNCLHRKIRYLPMGRDFRSKKFHAVVRPTSKKSILLYCNFSVNTHPSRGVLRDRLNDLRFATVEHMGEFLNYPMHREIFYEKISRSKFVLCPRGNAIDTFRLWDCLYLGAIPVVFKEAVFHEEIADLPILFLSSFEELCSLSEFDLAAIYDEMLDKCYAYHKLQLRYWLS